MKGFVSGEHQREGESQIPRLDQDVAHMYEGCQLEKTVADVVVVAGATGVYRSYDSEHALQHWSKHPLDWHMGYGYVDCHNHVLDLRDHDQDQQYQIQLNAQERTVLVQTAVAD